MMQHLRPAGFTRITMVGLLALFAAFMFRESFAGQCAIGNAVPAELTLPSQGHTP